MVTARDARWPWKIMPFCLDRERERALAGGLEQKTPGIPSRPVGREPHRSSLLLDLTSSKTIRKARSPSIPVGNRLGRLLRSRLRQTGLSILLEMHARRMKPQF